MRHLAALGGFLGAFALVSGQTYDYGTDVNISQITRRQDESAPVTIGRLPLSHNGSLPLRPEIRQMQADSHRWDLYILALSMFQAVSQDDPTSWYQIAGIHGVPYQTWNGVGPEPGAEESGYCPHSSILFCTWHRPYLALFEQEMFRMVNIIANMFPNATDRLLYQQAASDFRIPYWDWAISAPAGQTHFPDVFWNATMEQKGPRGVQTISNPLYAYQFHPKEEAAFIWDPLKEWDETKRAPNLTVSITDPPSHNEQVNAALLAQLPGIQQRLYILYSSYKDYNAFSNKGWAVSQNLSTWDSLESVHDIIHIYGGLKGHMTYVPLSAFDPLFFLHHAQTDRLAIFWQVLNPNSWMRPEPAGETSYTALKGTIQQSDTPLTPFLINDNTFWNSDMARTPDTFGYSYADVVAPIEGYDVQGELIKKITKWYGGTSLEGLRAKARAQKNRRYPHEIRTFREAGGRFNGQRPNVKLDAENPPVSSVVKNGRYTEWIANVRVNTEALDGRFSIYFFIGDVPDETCKWDGASNLIGTVPIFSMDRNTGSESKISGTLPLTLALLKMVGAGEIPSLAVNVAEPFLRETLQFRVLGSNDEVVDPRLVAGLYVGISSSEVKVPSSDREFPAWGPVKTRFEMWV